METIKLQLEPLTCPSCIKKIETKVGKMEGVEEAKVLFNSSKVKATFNSEQVSKGQIADTIEKLGYKVLH
ncbi:heavy-metal-associated domain-containing protein [Fredinandcohnia sp. QZ13]|uniref:heavy-metal-associated domain-containing protein n=1 Tax=Fredinandcohnia sp. QZ13 TaxID=3073144 RepID=UPI00285318F1|nr:heavy-metal-associated domain-containing protein [Fredinandcohnia sp. QZ13]MDR4890260.1 heavy-metal-associated domain-containing protein [Fredinandcohnia sp. QZ13]